jgi:hypothetical protein
VCDIVCDTGFVHYLNDTVYTLDEDRRLLRLGTSAEEDDANMTVDPNSSACSHEVVHNVTLVIKQ